MHYVIPLAPTHECPGCTAILWSDSTDTDIPCACGEAAAPIVYCPACDRPGCTIGGHQ